MSPRPNRETAPKPQRKPARRVTPARKRSTTRSATRNRQTRTLMKISSDDNMRSWVTLQLPAWLLALMLIVLLIGAVAILSSPELATRLSVAFYQLSQWLREKRVP